MTSANNTDDPVTLSFVLTEAELGWLQMALRMQVSDDRRKAHALTRKFGAVDPTSSAAARCEIGPTVTGKLHTAMKVAKKNR